jgi:hypothetical protein
MLARLGPEVSHSEITPGPPQPAVRQAQPDRTNKGLSALSNSTTSAAPVRIFPDPTLPGAGGHGEGRRAAHRSSSLGPFDVYATQPSGGTPRDDSHLKCTSSLLPPPASAAPARLQSTTIVLGHSLLVPDPSAHFSQRSRNRDISMDNDLVQRSSTSAGEISQPPRVRARFDNFSLGITRSRSSSPRRLTSPTRAPLPQHVPRHLIPPDLRTASNFQSLMDPQYVRLDRPQLHHQPHLRQQPSMPHAPASRPAFAPSNSGPARPRRVRASYVQDLSSRSAMVAP